MRQPLLTVERPPSFARAHRGYLRAAGAALALALLGVALLTAGGTLALPFERIVTVRGTAASGTDFFEDEEVRRILLGHHIEVRMTRAPGSVDLAGGGMDGFDFAFPSGQHAGELITGQYRSSDFRSPFATPIVLATFRPYAEALVSAGSASRQPPADGQGPTLYYEVDMAAFLDHTEQDRSWTDLGVEEHGATNDNVVLAQTADVCDSNSAGAYLALVAFTRNGRRVPWTEAEAQRVAEEIRPLLRRQGMGIGDRLRLYTAPDGELMAPVVVLYENQFLAYQADYRERTGELDDERVLLYPDSWSLSQPQFIAFTPEGDRLHRLILNDPALRRRAMELGYRPLDPTIEATDGPSWEQVLTGRGVPVPAPSGSTRALPPAVPNLERMIEVVGGCSTAEESTTAHAAGPAGRSPGVLRASWWARWWPWLVLWLATFVASAGWLALTIRELVGSARRRRAAREHPLDTCFYLDDRQIMDHFQMRRYLPALTVEVERRREKGTETGVTLGLPGAEAGVGRLNGEEVVQRYLEEATPISVIGVIVGALERERAIVRADLPRGTARRDPALVRAVAAVQGPGPLPPRIALGDLDGFVLVRGRFSRSDDAQVGEATVFDAPYPSGEDDAAPAARVRVVCRTTGLRESEVPDGSFPAQCLGKVRDWHPESGVLVISALAIFQ
ncbi:hypothetical protein [Streptomyces sp. NPDC127098]|uniref:hypothetical protein n=1 Tax=Streptomyces sp. NPDC127098 TaxID=3347137 RepID=UPI0036547F6E